MESITCNCMGYEIYSNTLDNLPVGEQTLVSTINQYSYCIAEEDAEFKEALQHSDVLLPDGVGIVAAAKILKDQPVKKITGSDLHQHLLSMLNRIQGKCFYLGSSNETLEKIKRKLKKEYPGIKSYFYSPPFKSEFSDNDNSEMIKMVNEVKPDVLFIGMTAPKQEKWAYRHKKMLKTKLICPVGAVFDFYAGTIQRPSEIWIKLGLEWLGRLVKEPKRLYKRYLIYGPVFMYKLIVAKLNAKATNHNQFAAIE